MLEFRIDEKAVEKIKEKLSVKQFRNVIELSLFRIGQEMASEAKRLSPIKTGTLRRSIDIDLQKDSVRVGTDTVYARILDQGGTIKAHTIYPKTAKALRFYGESGLVFAKRVNMPARTVKPYKGRGYLTPAFNTQKGGRALQILAQEFKQALA